MAGDEVGRSVLSLSLFELKGLWVVEDLAWRPTHNRQWSSSFFWFIRFSNLFFIGCKLEEI